MEDSRKKLFAIRGLKHYFPVRGKRDMFVKANDGIDIDIYDGETLGIVGESGCGKSTLGRVLLQLYKRTQGSIMYYGKTLDYIPPKYIESIAKSLTKHKKNISNLAKVCEEKKAECDKDPEDFTKLEEYNRAAQQYETAYVPIVSLLGGLLIHPDVNAVKMAYCDWYNAAKVRAKLRRRREEVQLDIAECEYVLSELKKKNPDSKASYNLNVTLSTRGSSARTATPIKLEKLNAIKADIEQKESEADKILQGKYAMLAELRQQCKDDPNYARHEAYNSEGIDLALLDYSEMRLLRKDMQIIFQDPYSSLNPRMSVGQIIGEGLLAHKFFKTNSQRLQDFIIKIMQDCGLAPYMLHRYPNQFSGGQRQRIGIARALAVQPTFVVCDEAVSALDVSIQSQIINLLQDLREKSNLTYMFISHDMSVIKYISDRIGVMYVGSFVELCSAEKLFEKPMHPYTVALLEAIPTTDAEGAKKEVKILEGDIPSPVNPPPGCKFHTRCQYMTDICKEVEPLLEEAEPGHFVACHHRLGQ